jgi:hypothetical protein
VLKRGKLTRHHGMLRAISPQKIAHQRRNLIVFSGGWAKIPVPRPGTAANDLNAVSAVSASDAWAVGVSYDTHVGKMLTMHWNGTCWTRS